jgi:DNA-binding beta-propeller fold protein YncE
MNAMSMLRFGARPLLAEVFIILQLWSFVAGASDTKYRVLQQWPLRGEGGWNYMVVGSEPHLLYISRDTRMTVIDTRTGKTAGEITGLADARGIAFDPGRNVGYISDGIAGVVHVFDLRTLHLVSSIVLGGTLDAIVFEPTTHLVFVFNTHSRTAAVIDPSSNRVTARISLPGRPAIAAADGKGSVFVNIVSAGELARIDARSLKMHGVWPLNSCVGPTGLAIDANRGRVFSVCENKKMVVSDASTGKLVSSLPIGEGAKGVAFDGGHDLIFSSNGEGSLTIIRENSSDNFSVIQTLPTQPGARAMALDPGTGQLYLVSARFGQRTGTSEELQFRPAPIRGTVVVLVVDNDRRPN